MVKTNFTLKTRWFMAALLVVFCAVSVSGCASFRKKFVRKKKAKSESTDFVPVLVPVEYPRPATSPDMVYKDHYGMAKAYFKDLGDIVGSRDSSDKQQLYVLNQITERMGLMSSVLADGEKKSSLDKLALEMREVISRYDQPDGIRRYDLIKRTLRNIEKEFYKSFKPALVQDDLKSAP
jgi:hypothetical protein